MLRLYSFSKDASQNYGVQPVVPSMAVFEKLKSKHPSKNAVSVDEAEWENILNYEVPENAVGMVTHWNALQSIVNKMRMGSRGSKAGVWEP